MSGLAYPGGSQCQLRVIKIVKAGESRAQRGVPLYSTPHSWANALTGYEDVFDVLRPQGVQKCGNLLFGRKLRDPPLRANNKAIGLEARRDRSGAIIDA